MNNFGRNIRVVLPVVVILLILLSAGLYWLVPVLRFTPKDCLGGAYAGMFKGEDPELSSLLSQEDVNEIVETLVKQISSAEDKPAGYVGYISTLSGINYRRAWQFNSSEIKEIPLDNFISAWGSSPSPDLPERVYNVSFFAEKNGMICVRLDGRYNVGLSKSSRGGFSEMWVFRRIFWLTPAWKTIARQKIFMFD
jgi:hypothetical protein